MMRSAFGWNRFESSPTLSTHKSGIVYLSGMKERLIVIVPGSRTKVSASKLLNGLLERSYGYLGVDTENDNNWVYELRGVLLENEPSTDVLIFSWSGGVTRTFSLNKAAENLLSMLSAEGYKEVVLLCKSLGGVVGEIAAKKYDRKIKIIEIATPHSPFERRISKADIVNIYSPQDRYAKLCNKVLYWGFGKNTLGRARNISLPNIGHSLFNKNIEINYQNRKTRLFEFYKQIIADDSCKDLVTNRANPSP